MKKWKRRKLFEKLLKHAKVMHEICHDYCRNINDNNSETVYKNCEDAINEYILFYNINLSTFLENNLFREKHYEVFKLAILHKEIIEERHKYTFKTHISALSFTTTAIGNHLKNINVYMLSISELAFSLENRITMLFLKNFMDIDIKTICELYYSSMIIFFLSIVAVLLQIIYDPPWYITVTPYAIMVLIIFALKKYIDTRKFGIDKSFYCSIIEADRTLKNLSRIVGDITNMNDRLKILDTKSKDGKETIK